MRGKRKRKQDRQQARAIGPVDGPAVPSDGGSFKNDEPSKTDRVTGVNLITLPRRLVRREGVSSLEVVMTTAAIFPSGVFLAYHAMNACRVAFSLIGTMTGSPLI